MRNFLRKAFLVEAIGEVYPATAESIRQSIEKHITPDQKLEFSSEKKPVTFFLDGVHYQAEVNEAQARGGYFINCTEIKENK